MLSNIVDAEIILPDDFYVLSQRTDLTKIPNWKSFMLTSADMILSSYITECISALQFFKSQDVHVNIEYLKDVFAPLGSPGEKRLQCYILMDLFLSALSTVITYVLDNGKIRLCLKCVDRYITDAVKQMSNAEKHDIRLVDFVCDENSYRVLRLFAEELQRIKKIKKRSNGVPFTSLLTWKKNNEEQRVVNEHWFIHYWLWVHQVFSMCGNSAIQQSDEHQRRRLMETVIGAVYIPIVQLPCAKCSRDAYLGAVDVMVRNDAAFFVNIKSATRWNEYGRFLHNHVSNRISLFQTESTEYDTQRFTKQEFDAEVLPFLAQTPMKFFVPAYYGECESHF